MKFRLVASFLSFLLEDDDILPKPSAVTLKADFGKRLQKAQEEALLGR